jgi:CBS domain containing-hemolysin-like protein
VNASPEEIREVVQKYPHNRLLVARDDLDHLLGVVETRVLLARVLSGEPVHLASVPLSQPLVLPEGTSALRALEALKQNPVPVAIVVDEYGTVEGMVTASDLLAAIAGELSYMSGGAASTIVPEAKDSWLLDGSLGIDRLEELLHVKRLGEDEDFHTLAGLVLSRLGHVPKVGESFDLAGYRFEVVEMDGNRIARARVSRARPAGPTPVASASGSALKPATPAPGDQRFGG